MSAGVSGPVGVEARSRKANVERGGSGWGMKNLCLREKEEGKSTGLERPRKGNEVVCIHRDE